VRTKTSQQSEKILDAAGRLFGTQRFHEVRMEDIAEDAQVGKGTLYRYFSDKEALYHALLERASREFTQLLKGIASPEKRPRECLEAVTAAIITYFDDHPHLLELIQRAEIMRPAGAPLPWQETRQELVQVILDLFDRGRKEGEFAVAEPDLAVLLLLGGIRSVIRFGKQPRPRGLAGKIVEQFIRPCV
jgi:AcrR family transcriptional regulator